MPIKIFFCYVREDETLLKELKKHLKQLEREKLVEFWYDRDILAGVSWDQEIKDHLHAAQIVILLVSPDFMNSDYCIDTEMRLALKRHERGEIRVIPVILRYVDWQGEPLGKLKALPKDGKPVISKSWHSPDEAFNDVSAGIRKVVKDLTAHYASALTLNKEKRPAKIKTQSTFKNEAIHVNEIKDDILHVVHIFETKGGSTFRDIKRYLPRSEKGELQTTVDDMLLANTLSKYKSGKTFRYTTLKET